MNSSISSRLSALRFFLKDHGLNGWIVPMADPHLSEYVDEHYAFRKWLSGFTGSAGSLLVTQDAAALVTDSRYWVQAEQQLEGSGIELVKLNQGYAAESADWFAAHLMANDCVGINSELISSKDAKPEFLPRNIFISRWFVRRPKKPSGKKDRNALKSRSLTIQFPRETENRNLPLCVRFSKKRAPTTCSHLSSTISPGSLICAVPMCRTTRSSTPTR